MYKYFPNLQNGVDDADVDEIKDAFNEIENDITALQNKKETDPTVPSWAKEPQKPTYTADEVGALPSDTKIPTKISDLENDLMDFAEIQDLVENVGDLDNLTTEDKSNIVNAVNELDAKLAEKANGAYVEEIQSQLESDLADEKRERIDADNQFIGVVQNLSETINDVSKEINEEIAEREEADTALGLAIQNASKIYVVTELPTEDIDENGIYIVTDNSGTIGGGGAGGGSIGRGANGGHYYGEIVCDATAWVRTNGEWLRIGVVKNTIGDAIDVAKEQIYQSIGSVSGSVLTLERLISGDGISLETNADTIIGAINEIKDAVSAEKTDREEADIEIKENIGDLESLTTDDKSSFVNAINELNTASEWKLIGEAKITQEAIDEAGEDGITAITLDLGEPVTEWYGETMIEITIPKADSLNSFSNGQLRVYFKHPLEANFCYILAPQSNGNLLNPTWTQRIIATSIWLNKERLSHSLITYKSYSAASGYITTPYTTENNLASAASSIIGKRYLSVWGFNGSSDGNTPFKFPKNSTLKLYGRF